MAAREDYNGLFKSLLTAFFAPYIHLFYPELIDLIDFNSADYVDKEGLSSLFPGDGTRLYPDLVVKVRLTEAGRIVYPGQDFLAFIIETQKTHVYELRPRMLKYRTAFQIKYPLTEVVVTGLYLDGVFDGIGADQHVEGQPLSKTSNFQPGSVAIPPRIIANHCIIQWPYVALGGLRAKIFLPHADQYHLIPALIGFMKIHPNQDKARLQAEMLLKIALYPNLNLDKKDLLAQTLVVGMNLSEADKVRFNELINTNPRYQRTRNVLNPWIRQGIEQTVLRMLSRRFAGQITEQIQQTVKAMKPEELNLLADELVDPSIKFQDLGLVNDASRH